MSKDLTEAWKKGELEDGEYYVKLIGDKVYILAREDNHWYEFGWKNTEEENVKLRELLKECKNKADEALQAIQKDCESDDWSIFHYPEVQYFYNNLEDKIDEVLK